MTDDTAQAFMIAADNYRLARDNFVAVMRLCQQANVDAGREADDVADGFHISLEWAGRLTEPGPLPDPDDIVLHSDVRLAQFVADLLADPGAAANEVIRASVLSVDLVEVQCGAKGSPDFVAAWNARASSENIELHWLRRLYSLREVESFHQRLVSGDGGLALDVRGVNLGEHRVTYLVGADDAVIDVWRRDYATPGWAHLVADPR